MNRLPSKYSQFFAILKKIGRDKEDVVLEFTKGHTKELSKLSEGQFSEMMRRLARYNVIPPGDRQRKKMISIAGNMNWGKNTNQVIAALDAWLLKQKYKKPLMQHTEDELNKMLTILEEKVWVSYLEGLNK